MAKTTMTDSSSKPRKPQAKAPAKTPGRTVAAGRGVRAAVTNPSGGRLPRFMREVRVEMSKVTWPSRPELVQSTVVVIVAIAIAAAYIGLLDLIWSSLVNWIAL